MSNEIRKYLTAKQIREMREATTKLDAARKQWVKLNGAIEMYVETIKDIAESGSVKWFDDHEDERCETCGTKWQAYESSVFDDVLECIESDDDMEDLDELLGSLNGSIADLVDESKKLTKGVRL